MGLDVAVPKAAEREHLERVPYARRTGPFGAGTVGPLRVDDQDNWQFRFRVHRDFYP